MPKREGVRIEDVGLKVEAFLFAEFGEQGNELLEGCLRVNGDRVRRIHLQGELYAVGVFDYSEDGSVLLVRLLHCERRSYVVEFARN